MESQKTLNSHRNPAKEQKQKISHFLISNYTIKLQSSKQYGTGIKTDKQTNGTESGAQKKPKHIQSTNI